jgi:ATP-dependent Clp endopeptidase proteolytic subunit ClpP
METHIYIYSQIGQGGVTAESIRKKLVNSGDEVTVHINSPGGEVYEGYTIYNILRNSGKKINVVIEGLCASIATLIACAGDTIVMNPTAEFMIHNPMVGIEGDSEDLRKVADQLDQIKKTIIAAYKRKTNKSEEELWDMMNRETFLSADMAKEFGFVDDVQQALKVVAYLDIKKFKNDIPMDQKILDAINSLGSKIEGIFKSKPKNLDMTLQDGTQILVDTESETELNGKAAFIVTPEGNQPAPDGEHVLADGRSIVVAGGMIQEVKEPQAQAEPTVEDLKKQVEDLTNQLAAKNTEIENFKKESETVKAELATTKTQVEEVKNEFEKIRNTVLGNPKDPKKQFVPKAEGKVENELLNGLLNKIKQKAN